MGRVAKIINAEVVRAEKLKADLDSSLQVQAEQQDKIRKLEADLAAATDPANTLDAADRDAVALLAARNNLDPATGDPLPETPPAEFSASAN